MKVLMIGDATRIEKFIPHTPFSDSTEQVIVPLGCEDADIIAAGEDAAALVADAIAPVSARLIEGIPSLKLIHSEGVAFSAIDIEAARAAHVPVCNCKGMNAVAVAEQTLLLILGLTRDVVAGDAAVREGTQIKAKHRLMVEGIHELCGAKVGLIGLGDIGRETAKRLVAFGADVSYYQRTRLPIEEERALDVRHLPLGELLAESEIVSLHLPVTAQTAGMVNAAFLAKMRADAYLVNTSRGELVENEALARALVEGRIAGAGLDTIAPEPVTADNPLVALLEDIPARVLYSPHIGGVTTNSFHRGYDIIWGNIERIAHGEEPVNIVNR